MSIAHDQKYMMKLDDAKFVQAVLEHTTFHAHPISKPIAQRLRTLCQNEGIMNRGRLSSVAKMADFYAQALIDHWVTKVTERLLSSTSPENGTTCPSCGNAVSRHWSSGTRHECHYCATVWTSER